MEFFAYQMPTGSVQPDTLKTESDWLDPLFVPPRSTHRRTFILLHGRSSNAFSFGSALLAVKLPSTSSTLAETFPDARFIFPTTKMRRAAALNGVRIAQWFVVVSLEDPDQQQELQRAGLRESAEFIHDIILREAELVGIENVVLGGLSQGCAMGLHALMSFQSDPGRSLGGFFGMSGWLPFSRQLVAIAEGRDPESTSIDTKDQDERNPFDNEEPSENAAVNPTARAIHFVRQDVMDSPETKINKDMPVVPIFLGHGELDEKVSASLGKNAADTMARLGWPVKWKSYSDLNHWYSPEELEDVARFVQSFRGNGRTG